MEDLILVPEAGARERLKRAYAASVVPLQPRLRAAGEGASS